MKKRTFLWALVLVLSGCISRGKIAYNVRVDHFDGVDAVVIVFLTLNSLEHWDQTSYNEPPLALGKRILQRELKKKGVRDYIVADVSTFRVRENIYRISFRLTGERDKLSSLLGLNIVGDEDTRKSGLTTEVNPTSQPKHGEDQRAKN